MKKHLVRLMALLLAASMLAACGSNSVNTAGAARKRRLPKLPTFPRWNTLLPRTSLVPAR